MKEGRREGGREMVGLALREEANNYQKATRQQCTFPTKRVCNSTHVLKSVAPFFLTPPLSLSPCGRKKTKERVVMALSRSNGDGGRAR